MEYKLVRRRDSRYSSGWRPYWYVEYIEDGEQIRRSTGCENKTGEGGAEQWLARFIAERSRPSAGVVVGEILRRHIVDLHEREARSIKRIASHLGIVDRELGAYEPDNLHPSVIERTTRRWRESGAADGTIRTRYLHLRAALSLAERRKWIEKAPYIELPTQGEARDRYLTRDEFKRLYAAAAELHTRTFLAIAIYTGYRAGAILSLTWDNIDFDHAFVRPDRGTENKKRPHVPINTPLALALSQAWLNREGPYVVHWKGERVGSMKRSFRTARRNAGIDHVTIHDLRRTCATWMAQGRTSMEEIAAVLGDSVTITQKHYARFHPDHLRSATAALE